LGEALEDIDGVAVRKPALHEVLDGGLVGLGRAGLHGIQQVVDGLALSIGA
jgi:hypothetical protein